MTATDQSVAAAGCAGVADWVVEAAGAARAGVEGAVAAVAARVDTRAAVSVLRSGCEGFVMVRSQANIRCLSKGPAMPCPLICQSRIRRAALRIIHPMSSGLHEHRI